MIRNPLSQTAHLHFDYLLCCCTHRWCSALQVLQASLLFDLVQGGSWLTGRRDRLLRPIIYQFVKIVRERASLVVAVVGLDLSKACDWLRRWGGCGCRE